MDSRRFATNYFFQTAGRALTMAFGLVTVGVLTRALSAAEFGAYTTGLTFLQFFGVIVDFGLTLTLTVMISEAGADHKRIVGNLFSMRLASGMLVFGLAPLAVLAFPYPSSVRDVVLVGAVAYWLMSGATLLVGVFQRHAAMWRSALAETLNRAVLLALVVAVTSVGLGLQAIIAATAVANLVWLAATLWLARPFVDIRPRFDADVWKEAVRRSWPIALSIALNLVYLKGDILFLSLFRPSEDVAVYGVAYKVLDVLTALPVMFMGLLLPALVADWTEGRREAFRAHMARAFDVFAATTVPIAVGAQAVGTRLVTFIAGDAYAGSGPLLNILILALVAVFFSSLYGHAVVAVQRQRTMIWGYAATAVVATAGYLWLIPTYGAWGAAAVTLVSEAMVAAITCAVVVRASGAVPSFAVALKAAACSALMYAALAVLPETHVLVDVAAGAIVYLAAMTAVGGMDARKILRTKNQIH
jgi:O-antigen/teichoic acid export membrane protein